ncbi:MucBP domain-containing protein [Lactococcus lactis]|jgi:LPXTG-motif cell wall-anchored protein|uniref:MucBP domain-containing protein n=1 Tax=Lactococcus lactis TaxID=1358 RepID=UPI00165259AF|nr:MucBP domain-containing protein [Lactococcus lactis]MDR1823040.1 MucBP domain-containing protein [Lactococcus lactis]QNL91105.1 MucBP domain-containing protein [Lactococcus lactis]
MKKSILSIGFLIGILLLSNNILVSADSQVNKFTVISTKDSSTESIDSWMPDKTLQAAIAKQLGFSDVNMITKSSIQKLTYLSFSEQTGSLLSSLTGLEFATNLSVLYIPKSEVSDITPLAKCTKLTQLYLMFSKIDNIAPLKNLNNLFNLHLDSNPFTDYSPIAGLTNIEEFGSRHSNIKNISFLSNWSKIKLLYLWDNDISDFSLISNLTNLKTLELSYNDINDSSLLINYPLLTQIYLDGNNISDISPLSNINSLQYLSIFGNHISDISPLSKLSNLGTLNADNQTISLNKISVGGKSYIQESNIKSKNGVIVALAADSQDEKGTDVNNGIEWTNLNESGFFNSTWTDKGNNFSGRIVLPYERKKESELVLDYLDINGKKISDNIVLKGQIDDGYDVSGQEYKKIIPGYTLKEVQGNVIGKFTDKVQTIIYVYKKNPVAGGAVKVKYIDTYGNIISKDVNKSGNIGEDYSTEQKTIAGYTFKEVQGNVTGKFIDKVQTITYVYKKNIAAGGVVTVKYIDTDGNTISKAVNKLGNIGEDYSTEQKIIPGYTFREIQGNATGQFTAQVQTVTYVYIKKPAGASSSKVDFVFSKKATKTLPQTGENPTFAIVVSILGSLLLGVGLVLCLLRTKKKLNNY